MFCSIQGGRYKNIAPLNSSAIRHTRRARRACLRVVRMCPHAADRAPPQGVHLPQRGVRCAAGAEASSARSRARVYARPRRDRMAVPSKGSQSCRVARGSPVASTIAPRDRDGNGAIVPVRLRPSRRWMTTGCEPVSPLSSGSGHDPRSRLSGCKTWRAGRFEGPLPQARLTHRPQAMRIAA